jgi:hemoglobin-like flavoprotein
MTAEEKRRIRESFAVLRDQAGPVAMLFYGKLFSLDPTAQRLFHNDLALQGKKLMDTLNAVVESLDEFHVMQPRLADLGRRHAEYGVRPEQYDTLEKALLWTLAQALGTDFDRPTREAWQAAIRAINSAMKKA